MIGPIELPDDPSFHTVTLYNISESLPRKLEFKYYEILLFHVIAIILLIEKNTRLLDTLTKRKIDLILVVFKGVYQKWN